MTKSRITEYENYPSPEQGTPEQAISETQMRGSGPVVHSEPSTPSESPVSSGPSRRTVLALIGGAVGVAVLVATGMEIGGGAPFLARAESVEGFGSEIEPGSDLGSLYGQVTTALGESWGAGADGANRVVASRKNNRVIFMTASTDIGVVTKLLPRALVAAKSPFVGASGSIKDVSTTAVRQARATATGRFNRERARQIVDVVLDSNSGTYLIAVQVLTEPEGSDAASEAADLVKTVQGAWPW